MLHPQNAERGGTVGSPAAAASPAAKCSRPSPSRNAGGAAKQPPDPPRCPPLFRLPRLLRIALPPLLLRLALAWPRQHRPSPTARAGALPLLLLRLALPWPRPHPPSPPPGRAGVDLRGRRPPHRRGRRPPHADDDSARPPRPITGSPAPPPSLRPRLAPARGLQQHGIRSTTAIGTAAALDSLDPIELRLRPRPLRRREPAAAAARSSPRRGGAGGEARDANLRVVRFRPRRRHA
jgi:hypothetical protein